MQEIESFIENNSAIFNVSDVERERVYADIVDTMAGVIAKRSRARAQRELRNALKLNDETKRAADDAEFKVWLAMVNAPETETVQ